MSSSHFASTGKPVQEESYDAFAMQLIRVFGATLSGEALTHALGYRTQDAFRKAQQHGRLPVATFEIEGRRGRFALAADIAVWLWSQRGGRSAAPTPCMEVRSDAVT